MSRSAYFYVLLFYHPLATRSVGRPLGAVTCSTSTGMQMFTSRRFACIYSFLYIKEKLDCQSAVGAKDIKSRIASLLVETASPAVCSLSLFFFFWKYTISEYWTCSLSPCQHLSYCPSSVISKSILIELS